MARKKSPVDAALEVARKVRVPKKPVKAKGKKTVPTKLDWGPGIPEDKLAYLNDEEMALVQAKRGYKGKRSVDGIPAFPDPGDTAAGDRGTGSSGRPSSGGSSGPDRGPTGGPSSGNGGLGGGGKGGTSGGAGGAGGLGGGGKGGPSGGAGGTSSSSAGTGAGAGSSDKGQKTTGPSGGPSGGPTSAPARTAPSATVSTSSDRTPSISQSSGPVTFGPTSSSQQTFVRTSAPTGGYNPVSSAPSTMAYQGALDRIAQGSSVVGGRPIGKMQDRVPQAQPTAVNFSQTPTVSGPPSGFMSPEAQRLDRENTQYSPKALGDLYKDINTYGISDMNRRIAAQQQLLGQTIGASKYGASVTANLNNKLAGTGTINPFTSNVATHWTGGPEPVSNISGYGYAATIDNQGNINYTRPFTASGEMQQTQHMKGLNNQYVGISSQGIQPNEQQLKSAAVMGQNWFNPNATVSTHGYEAGTRVLSGERDLPAQNIRQEAEGAALAGAFAGKPNQTASRWSPTQISPTSAPPAATPSVTVVPASYTINPATSPTKQYTDRVPGSVAGGPTFTPAGSSQIAKDQARLGISTPYGDVSPEQLSAMAQEDQQRLAGMSYTPPNTQAQNYGFVNPNVSTSPTRGMPPISPAPAVTANNSFVSNPYNKSPAEQARDIRNAVALAMGDNTPTRTASTEINVPGRAPDVSPSQGDYSPSQAPAYDVSPSQQSGWTDAQREAYLSGLAGSRQGPVRPILPNRQTPPVTQVASVPPTYLQPLPDWQDYSYLYNDYPQIVSATPAIAEFNQYNATMNRGGRIGNSIDAAMRLARQSIVSRNKTR